MAGKLGVFGGNASNFTSWLKGGRKSKWVSKLGRGGREGEGEVKKMVGSFFFNGREGDFDQIHSHCSLFFLAKKSLKTASVSSM